MAKTRKRALEAVEARKLGVGSGLRFRDRVVGLRRVRASELRAHPKNWRLHPEGQKGALGALLSDIGFVDAVIARETPSGLELIDGHLRADLAEDSEVPVIIVDLNDEETDKMLAAFDPISGMALVDAPALAGLLAEIDLDGNAELRRLLTDLQADLVADQKKGGVTAHEVPGMALQPHEHYDFLVVLATTTHEWNVLCDRL